MQRRLLAAGRHGLQGLGRDREPVADAAGLDHDVVGPADEHLAAHRGDHPTATGRGARRPRAACRGARVAGVADRDRERVGGVVGLGRLGEPEQRADHLLDLVLGGGAAAADRHLHRLRRVVEAGDPALAGGEHRDAARLADGDRRAHVLAEVEVLERDRGRLVPGDQLARARRGCAPGAARRARPAGPRSRRRRWRSSARRHAHDAEPRVRHARVYAHDDDHGY